jgi:hypothetical protein
MRRVRTGRVGVPHSAARAARNHGDKRRACDRIVSKEGGGTLAVRLDGAAGTLAAGAASDLWVWDFKGFESPVDNLRTYIELKGGRVLPLKWRQPRRDARDRARDRQAERPEPRCELGMTLDLIEEFAIGGSGLQNLGDGYYQLNWATPKSYTASCKTLKLDLGEGAGVTRDAAFRFTR